MKRLVWILLAVFGTVLAQVQPVAFPALQPSACHCRHCNCGGSCGMPGCLPPAPTRTLPTATQPSSITVAEASHGANPARTAEKFFAVFVESAAVVAAPRAPDRVAPAANVPLFAAHCSFLI